MELASIFPVVAVSKVCRSLTLPVISVRMIDSSPKPPMIEEV